MHGGRCIYGPRLQREARAGGKDLGVTEIERVVETMGVDGNGEGVCV